MKKKKKKKSFLIAGQREVFSFYHLRELLLLLFLLGLSLSIHHVSTDSLILQDSHFPTG